MEEAQLSLHSVYRVCAIHMHGSLWCARASRSWLAAWQGVCVSGQRGQPSGTRSSPFLPGQPVALASTATCTQPPMARQGHSQYLLHLGPRCAEALEESPWLYHLRGSLAFCHKHHSWSSGSGGSTQAISEPSETRTHGWGQILSGPGAWNPDAGAIDAFVAQVGSFTKAKRENQLVTTNVRLSSPSPSSPCPALGQVQPPMPAFTPDPSWETTRGREALGSASAFIVPLSKVNARPALPPSQRESRCRMQPLPGSRVQHPIRLVLQAGDHWAVTHRIPGEAAFSGTF